MIVWMLSLDMPASGSAEGDGVAHGPAVGPSAVAVAVVVLLLIVATGDAVAAIVGSDGFPVEGIGELTEGDAVAFTAGLPVAVGATVAVGVAVG